MRYRNKRRWIIVISLFLLLAFYLFKNLSTTLGVSSFILGIAVFYLIDHMFNFEFEPKHYLYIVIIFAFGILFSPLYFLSSVYDKALHLIMPIFASCIFFHIADRQNLSRQWKLLLVFLFVITSLAVLEIGEYLIDQLWDLKLQGVYFRDVGFFEKLNLTVSKIDDTMIDIILGVAGVLLFIVGKTTISFCRKRKSIKML